MAFSSRTIVLSTMLLTAAASPSWAQNSTSANPGTGSAGRSEQQFMVDNDLAMSDMTRAMLVKPTGDVDHDFAAMMIPHHQGAIDMARAELKYGHNEDLRRLAQNIIAQQQHEISIMRRATGEASQASDKPLPPSRPKPDAANRPTAMNAMHMK
ncbi:hypothetical protein BST63_24395 [Bradyrhizobium canariense]|uniref:DUF305 domain-containing protein n=1 Tax=Bradyrhizobium canariense TaxID=255045 RepID=A0ABX3WY08_9BRAD|nr:MULTISPECIES: DUF305 domain-containing protein [Bradyrhizobium]OSJ17153.1 hypothetical protein BSR47_10855 [Bradyrhizobium canariense]OSJ25050.1 hypothetical protein BST63_24395 [Bradyrhizobium canariense]WOH61688.1 DUF305 domain-containing protein [Bradyrhizobium sp. BWC-3-1]